MVNRLYASDSKIHLRQRVGSSSFRGIIGVVYQVHEPEKYIIFYNELMDIFFRKFGIMRLKPVYKASEIARYFPGSPRRILNALQYLVREFFQYEDSIISVFFSTFNLKSLRERYVANIPEELRDKEVEKIKKEGHSAEIFQIYGEPGREPVEYVSVTKFFEIIRQYYPVICLGSLCDITRVKECEFLLDGVTGPRSGYWDTLVTSENTISILPHGDEYNQFISTADIICRWMDEELRQGHLPLNMNAVIRILREWEGVTADLETRDKIHIAHLSNRQLGKMKPLSTRPIESFQEIYLKHPIYYIFLEEQTKQERLRFEFSPMMRRIHKSLSESGGTYLYWDTNRHPSLIRRDDIAIYYDINGKDEVDKLLSLTYEIKTWDLREVPS